MISLMKISVERMRAKQKIENEKVESFVGCQLRVVGSGQAGSAQAADQLTGLAVKMEMAKGQY